MKLYREYFETRILIKLEFLNDERLEYIRDDEKDFINSFLSEMSSFYPYL